LDNFIYDIPESDLRMKYGLFIGRFQPLHIGHVRVIKTALENLDRVIIVIGSSQESGTYDNPLTASERIEIMREALLDEGIVDKCMIISLPDINSDAHWVDYIVDNVPEFDIVISGDGLNKDLFSKAGYKIFELDRWNDISASRIRKDICDENLHKFVPKQSL